ncbi:MAG: cysteine desulfurase, partial [Rhodothermales bacterium]
MQTHIEDAERLVKTFDAAGIRAQFPALSQTVHGHPLVYLDNAATSQKPQSVIDRLVHFYSVENSNIHRGVHFLSQQATDAYESARARVAGFIHAESPQQVIFTRGTTEAINLVAATFGRMNVGPGDYVMISEMEHHSNIVPWQMLCQEKGAALKVIPIDDAGEIKYDEFERLLSERVKLLAIPHVSNALGTINPVKRMIRDAHDVGIPVLLDGAQAVPHMPVDVQDLDCDFYCFSSHKMFGPTGTGILFGKTRHLEAMPPYQGGGDMIDTVTFERSTYNEVPHKFEAGTPNIAGGIGLGAAVEFIEAVDREAAAEHEADLLTYATLRLEEIDGMRLIGTASEKTGVLSFLLGDVHPYDAGTILDRLGIAV